MSDQAKLTNDLLKKAGVIESSSDSPTGAPSGFDPMPIIEKLDLWWFNGTYYFRRQGDDKFTAMSRDDTSRMLRVDFGLTNDKMKTPDGVIYGQIDQLLNHLLKERYVMVAANVGGVKAGRYDWGGGRVLVTSSPKVIEPLPGECETILDFIKTLLGEDGGQRFLLWLKFGYEAVKNQCPRPGQCLVLAGLSGKGKGILQTYIISRILGGRHADPKKWLSGAEKFNEELIQSEHLKIEEIPASVRHDERSALGERIKELCVNHTQSLRGMHKSSVTVQPQQRLSMSLNDEPEKLKCLPPLTLDFRDKLLLLKTTSEDFFERYDNETENALTLFLRAVDKELPALATHLIALEVPQSLRDRRYGVRSYIDPEIEERLFELEPESLLLTLIDDCLFPSSLDFKEDGSGELNPWKGSATELREKLIADNFPQFRTARKLLDCAVSECGKLLGKLGKKHPDRFSESRTGKKRSWVIQPPSDD
jgi:hypothetical protein